MSKAMTPKQKKLAAMSGDKNKITRGDVITAAKMNASGKKCTCGKCAACKAKKAGKK